MAPISDYGKLSIQLFSALNEKNSSEIIKLCGRSGDGPFHIVTVHGDTVLHMAAYSRQKETVMKLLEMVEEEPQYEKLTMINTMGETILHEVATTDLFLDAAKQILGIAPPHLLTIRNQQGETALFHAARFGCQRLFKLLDDEYRRRGHSPTEIEELHLKLDTKLPHDHYATTLHMSVTAEHFDLALAIAEKYHNFVARKDAHGMTPLQLLSCKPATFYSASNYGLFEDFIYKRLSLPEKERTFGECIDEQEGGREIEVEEVEADKKLCVVPLIETLRQKKLKHVSAMRLAKFLIDKDISWGDTQPATNPSDESTSNPANETNNINTEKQTTPPSHNPSGRPTDIKDPIHTPLMLAAKNGIKEIVEGILKVYPLAIEHVTQEGRNVLHVAIKHKQTDILNMLVKDMKVPIWRLVRKIDGDGNTIFRMAGTNTEVPFRQRPNPALELHGNLKLFETVKKICKSDYVEMRNNNQKTAEQLFAETNKDLLEEAAKWMERTAENCSIVAVLIATVAFAAAYTVPGGPDEHGLPVLQDNPFFILFTIADVVSITSSLTAVVIFLSILTSSYQYGNFKASLMNKLTFGLTLLMLSVTMMMLGFAATIILIIAMKGEWTKILLYSVAFLPVCIFVFTYLRLYESLWESCYKPLKKLWMAFPRFSNWDPEDESYFFYDFDERGGHAV